VQVYCSVIVERALQIGRTPAFAKVTGKSIAVLNVRTENVIRYNTRFSTKIQKMSTTSFRNVKMRFFKS